MSIALRAPHLQVNKNKVVWKGVKKIVVDMSVNRGSTLCPQLNSFFFLNGEERKKSVSAKKRFLPYGRDQKVNEMSATIRYFFTSSPSPVLNPTSEFNLHECSYFMIILKCFYNSNTIPFCIFWLPINTSSSVLLENKDQICPLHSKFCSPCCFVWQYLTKPPSGAGVGVLNQ